MKWISEDWSIIWHALLTTLIMLSVVMLVTRINGLRSFAKITPIDFAVTITIGSVVNSTVISDTNSILKGALVIALLIFLQSSFGWLKAKFKWFDHYVFNQPVFLMRDGKFIDQNIDDTRMSRSIILARLRAENVSDISQVRAVVLETTGDLSVITGNQQVDDYIICDVRNDIKDTEVKIDMDLYQANN